MRVFDFLVKWKFNDFKINFFLKFFFSVIWRDYNNFSFFFGQLPGKVEGAPLRPTGRIRRKVFNEKCNFHFTAATISKPDASWGFESALCCRHTVIFL